MKNNLYLYLVLGLLFSIFGIVSLVVYFTAGQSKYFVKKKLAIGAIIIGMTCAVNGCRPLVTCYDVAQEPLITCTDPVNDSGEIVINAGDTIIEFSCQYLYNEFVSYKILSSSQLVFSETCEKNITDSATYLTLNLPGTLNVGLYDLKLFGVAHEEINNDSYTLAEFKLRVIN